MNKPYRPALDCSRKSIESSLCQDVVLKMHGPASLLALLEGRVPAGQREDASLEPELMRTLHRAGIDVLFYGPG